MKKTFGEDITCLVCDYGWIILGILLLLVVGVWRYSLQVGGPETVVVRPTQEMPVRITPITTTDVSRIDTATLAIFVGTPEPSQASIQTLLPVPQFTGTVQTKKDFIMAFVPINWSSSMQDFNEVADKHAAIFIQASGIDQYFNVKILKLAEGLTVNLDEEESLLKILDFGISNVPADRYIGIADDNIVLDGVDEITGYSFGPGFNAVIVEKDQTMVTAHELGHTFGLCDEYSYSIWSEQNVEFEGGCPNPFPPENVCSHSSEELCPGFETVEGKNSIMGPSGLDGAYAFNDTCLSRLNLEFQRGSR